VAYEKLKPTYQIVWTGFAFTAGGYVSWNSSRDASWWQNFLDVSNFKCFFFLHNWE